MGRGNDWQRIFAYHAGVINAITHVLQLGAPCV